MHLHRHHTVFVLAVASASTLMARDAHAFARRVSAMGCVSAFSENAYTAKSDGSVWAKWQKGPELAYSFFNSQLFATAPPLDFYCPIPNDDNLSPTNTTELRVWGDHYSSQDVTIYACIQYYNGSGFECGNGTTVSSFGGYDAAVGDLTSWNHPWSWFEVPYAHVVLPYPDNLRGFYTHN
jgi:hypothetical protein